MRLWHYKLIPFLDRQHLLGQHRECCALRGNGWGRKHKTVDYVFKYSMTALEQYHMQVIDEMAKRGYTTNQQWHITQDIHQFDYRHFHYPEHDEHYLIECLLNLLSKGYNDVVESFLSSKANDTHITMHTLNDYIYM